MPLLPVLAAAALPAAPSFALPIACTPGVDCYVQNYVDHDPGPGWKDYLCRTMSYDGHTGTDIRVPTLAAVRAGVTVRAALAGRVHNMRDGVVDRPYVAGADTNHQDCGNAVLIDHGGGWQSLYCHMRQGSVKVKVGQMVNAGDALGLVGESGKAAFPHVHFEVLKDHKPVDPFAYGAAAGACSGGRSLWNSAAARALAYRSPVVLNAGFAGAAVTADQVEAGQTPALASNSSALVAFVRAIGLESGDVLALTLVAPDGRQMAATAPTIPNNQAQHMMFVGARLKAASWPKGTYRATLQIRRKGAVAASRTWTAGL